MRDQGGGRRGMELQCRIIRVTHVAVQMGHFVRSNKILLAVYHQTDANGRILLAVTLGSNSSCNLKLH